MVPRDHARIHDVLRKIGHTGTDEDIAQRIIAVARKAAIPVDVVCHDYACTEPHQRRVHDTCAIVGDIIRTGRSALILPDTGAACESDGGDYLHVYDVLRKVGHAGTEDDIAERILAAGPKAALRVNAICEDYACSAPRDSVEWRRNRAHIISIIVGSIVRVGRAACIMPDAGAVPCKPDDGSNNPIGVCPELKCPVCGAGTVAAGGGRWTCPCGARGWVRDGSPMADGDDYRRLCKAQMALVTAMAGTDDPDFIEEAADCYARLDSLILDRDKRGVGMHDGTTVPTGWLRPEHVGEMNEALAEAREIVTPNGACPKCDDPECGKVKCQNCGKLMHPGNELVECGDPVGYSCRACVYGEDDHSISELTNGECDGIECEGPPDDTHGGSGNRTRGG